MQAFGADIAKSHGAARKDGMMHVIKETRPERVTARERIELRDVKTVSGALCLTKGRWREKGQATAAS